MKTKDTLFLESDMLERYLMGTTSPLENEEVEHYIAKYPKVKETYIELQENLEDYATSYAVEPPSALKDTVLKAVHKNPKSKNAVPILTLVACAIAILFGLGTFMIWQQNQELLKDRELTNELFEKLNDDMVKNRESLQSVEKQFMILNNAATQKYVLRGNRRARKLQTVAYVNTLEKKSYVNVVALPELPDEQVYQLWADVDGKMVPLDILKTTKERLVEIPYEDRMASLNITIEPKGGSKEATVENIVANISF